MTRPAAGPVPRSWLYVPGHRADRVAKALASGADAVVVDLEDAVPAAEKEAARATAVEVSRGRRPSGVQLWVRVNAPRTSLGEQDVEALADCPCDGVRLPRVEDPDDVAAVTGRTRLPLQLLIESARGLLAAEALARSSPQVVGIGLGEADLAADLVVDPREGLEWARGAVVAAARAAGLASPVQSVWTDVGDLEGLAASSRRGAATGFFGRSVVHPRQIAVVHEAFTPDEGELTAANAVVRAAREAAARGESAVLDAFGRFVDPAVVRRAETVLARTRPTRPPDPDLSQGAPHA